MCSFTRFAPFEVLSCQACHVAYPARTRQHRDRSVADGRRPVLRDQRVPIGGPRLIHPHPDKSKWFPAMVAKIDSDGVERYFPQKREVAIYWADWDDKGTPGDYTDDVVHPIILWRVRGITGDQPLPGVNDDNGDSRLEVNTPAEMLLYMQALKGNDRYGEPVATNPVLIKGPAHVVRRPGQDRRCGVGRHRIIRV